MNYDRKRFAALLQQTGHAPKSKPDYRKRRRLTDAEFCELHFGVRAPASVIRLMREGKIEIPKRKYGK